jgi:hypothetical protein
MTDTAPTWIMSLLRMALSSHRYVLMGMNWVASMQAWGFACPTKATLPTRTLVLALSIR